MAEEIIKLWKEKNIDHVDFNFSCGGDSMNDTDIVIYDKDGNEVECSEIKDHIDDKVYNEVEFYVNSDGHYMGESGTVKVELVEDDEEPYLSYSKSSSSEWSESYQNKEELTLTDKQAEIVSKYVDNINGGEGGEIVVNFKTDCILTDEEQAELYSLETTINEFVEGYEPEDIEGELSDWYSFTTNDDDEQLKLVGNKLTLSITKQAYVYKDE